MNGLSNTVHGLWIKGPLSALEMLTVHSYLAQGYEFVLWVYDDPAIYDHIAGISVKDARGIIPEAEVFCYKHSNQFGHGKGSYAGFSDLFRYKLLGEQGGWWTDMDVSCIRRFDLPGPYVFRLSKEREPGVVGNIMHVPRGSDLMKWCYDEAVKVVHAESRDWMAPIRILNEGIERYQLTAHIHSFSNPDSWPVVSRLVAGDQEPQDNWLAIHWMNEEFRRLKVPKDVYVRGSYLGELMSKYGLGQPLGGFPGSFGYTFRVSRLYYAFLHFRRETIWQSMYYLAHNIFYAISDLYFVRIKPRYDIGKKIRSIWK